MTTYRVARETNGKWTAWMKPIMSGYRMRCCDCKLVHEFQFRIIGKRVFFRASRHRRATAASRRRKAKS